MNTGTNANVNMSWSNSALSLCNVSVYVRIAVRKLLNDFVLPSIASKSRGTATVPLYIRIAARRVQDSQRVRDPQIGTHLFQQAPSIPRTPSSLQIPPPLRIPSLLQIPSSLQIPPTLPLQEIPQTLWVPSPRPTRGRTDFPPTRKLLQLRLVRLPGVHLSCMSTNTESLATTVPRHIGSTFLSSTLSYELEPKNLQVGTTWLYLLS